MNHVADHVHSMRLQGTSLPMRGELVAGVDVFIQQFHEGAPKAIDQLYREHFDHVFATVRRYLGGADSETITHDVFCRLLSNEALRRNFTEGNLRAWLGRVAANAAIDHLRRSRRERGASNDGPAPDDSASQASCADELEARELVERFRRDHLPPQWVGVFEARFLRQLPQREAAKELGMRRTTLVYQEQQIRALLRAFLTEGQEP